MDTKIAVANRYFTTDYKKATYFARKFSLRRAEIFRRALHVGLKSFDRGLPDITEEDDQMLRCPNCGEMTKATPSRERTLAIKQCRCGYSEAPK